MNIAQGNQETGQLLETLCLFHFNNKEVNPPISLGTVGVSTQRLSF